MAISTPTLENLRDITHTELIHLQEAVSLLIMELSRLNLQNRQNNQNRYWYRNIGSLNTDDPTAHFFLNGAGCLPSLVSNCLH